MAGTLSSGSSGADVAQLHESLRGLGFPIAAPERRSRTFGPATVEALKQFQRGHQLRATGTLTKRTADALRAGAEAAPAAPIPASPVVPPLPIPAPSIVIFPPVTYVVTGTITAPGSASVTGLAVQLVDKNVGGDTVLASGQTIPGGSFTIQAVITASYLAQHSKTAPDLQAQALQNGTVAATSIVRYNASTSEQLDIALAAGQLPLASEYEALTAAVTAAYSGSLATLQENGQQQDITFLANKTGWDARAIAMASIATQLAQAPVTAAKAVPPPAPFYYALLRAGLPTDRDQLHATDAESVKTVWSQAIAQNVLPSSAGDELDTALSRFAAISAATAVAAPPTVGTSTLGRLLGSRFGQDPVRQQEFATMLVNNRADPATLWAESAKAFGPGITAQLQLDGQLAYLTVNNGPLLDALHRNAGTPISTPLDLVSAGYHDAKAWLGLLADVDPPPEFNAVTPGQAKADYAEALAAHVRLSFPTASVGQLVSTGGLGVTSDLQASVAAFLRANQAEFDIGAEPVVQFLARTGTQAGDDIVSHVSRIQRMRQITPNVRALEALTAAGIDSAHAVAQWSAGRFVSTFAESMGGTDIAALTHSRALTVHSATLQVTLAYLTGRQAPLLGSAGTGNLVDPVAGLAGPLPGTATFAEATLQDLFGNLDYCTCDDCRSITSPAAYLVDLLDYLNNPRPSAGHLNPRDVLLARRPDIGTLPLTCENTNIALPYIDLVNEILEYFAGHSDSIAGYPGHNTDGTATSPELIASPQYDDDTSAQAAYQTLKQNWFPPPLPFDRQLELLRAHVSSLGSSLYELMRALRPRDSLDPRPGDDASFYGWRDILIERLGLSRLEYQLLTDSGSVSVQQIYGYPATTDVAAAVSVLQEFSRRTGVDYDDIVSILQTRTVNPQSALLPLLQALDVPVAALQQLHAGTLDPAGFAALLPAGLDPARFGGQQPADIATWVMTNYDRLMQLIVIDVSGAPSDTTAMRLQHLNPDAPGDQLDALDLYRLLRFIRLWRKLGLDIATTDDLVQAFYAPAGPDTDTGLQQLDSGLQAVLLRAGVAYRAIDLLGLDPDTDLESLLTCWGPVSTNGPDSLYARLFLNKTVLNQDPVFAPDIQGRILTVTPPAIPPSLLAAKPALCAALGLTSAEFDLLTGTSTTPVAGLGLGYHTATPLTVENISALYRRAWLARTLRISILELLSLAHLTGLDPFATPVLRSQQPVSEPLLDFAQLVKALSAAGLAPVQALYLLWNADLSGVSAPPAGIAITLAAQLRTAFAAIDAQFSVTANPSPDAGKNLMSLVLGPTPAGLFFGLLTGSFSISTPFAYSQSTLPAAVLGAGVGRLTYDDLGKQLTFAGYLDAATLAGLHSAAGTDSALVTGIDALASAGQKTVDTFFGTYDDSTLGLRGLFTDYVRSADPTVKGSIPALLNRLLPVLAGRRKQVQSLSVASAAAGCDPSFATALLVDSDILAAASGASNPASADLTAIGRGGLSVAFFPDNSLASPPAVPPSPPATLDYGTRNPLPAPVGGAAGIAARWTGYLSAAQDGAYGLHAQTDAGATVSIEIAGADIAMTSTDGLHWYNQNPVALSAGLPSSITITAAGLTGMFDVTWESTGGGWQEIPAGNLYAADAVDNLGTTFLRFLKITSLSADLALKADDIAFLATRTALTVNGAAWTAQLAVEGVAPPSARRDLTSALRGMLGYAALKSAHAPTDDRLLSALLDLVGGAGTTNLSAVTGWDSTSLAALSHRLLGSADLGAVPGPMAALDRIRDAFGAISTCQLSAATLIAAATNAPSAGHVETFQAAVRSRYAEADWFQVVQTINDQIRTEQRDALVACVLLRSGTDVLSALGIAAAPNRLPTADDLFNYFLVDVEMRSCMQTSRIRHALSSVQLFIERCLRNLEPRVDPGDIDGTQWAWRKRYRVWQANREVFLWPENWMNESLRDDQSPFFKTAMRQLLQSDITDDTAAGAYLDYLSNLEQVAKLEPCGLYYDAAGDGSADDVVHVVARSSGTHRKHYYRRSEGGAWTAWQDTKLTIEDNPVLPYVWNGRLLLFWLQVHRSSAIDPGHPGQNLPAAFSGEPELGSATLSSITGRVGQSADAATREQISVVLCFSEYYNGAWQPVKTSDVNTPLDFTTAPAGTFDRTTLDVRPWTSADPGDGALYVQVTTRDRPPVTRVGTFHLVAWASGIDRGFVMHNTHSSPVQWSDLMTPISLIEPDKLRSLPPASNSGRTSLQVSYSARGADTIFGPSYQAATDVNVLTGALPQTVRQAQSDVGDQWSVPFFVSDARSSFYVTTGVTYRWFNVFGGYGLADAGRILRSGMTATIPPVVVDLPPVQPGAPVEITGRLGDPALAQQALGQASGMRAVLGSTSVVDFAGVSIGATGGLGALRRSTAPSDKQDDRAGEQ